MNVHPTVRYVFLALMDAFFATRIQRGWDDTGAMAIYLSAMRPANVSPVKTMSNAKVDLRVIRIVLMGAAKCAGLARRLAAIDRHWVIVLMTRHAV
ncbi:MAG: hypothetical protein VYC04_02170 [Actinomycetota bacterium]|nr:hypothetical protein [Actinomycetota bacterium]